MKKARALIASVIAVGAVIATAPASQATSTIPATVDYVTSANTTTSLANLAYGNTVTLSSVSATAVGLYASVCKAGASQMDIPAPCDPNQAHMSYIPPTTHGTGTIFVATKFGTGSGSVDCFTDQCVIYIRGSHDNPYIPSDSSTIGNAAYIRAIPFTAAVATASITSTWPAASKFKVGKTISVATSKFVSNVGETVHLASKTPKYCTVTATSAGWKIKPIKKGTCTLKAVTLAGGNGAYGSKTITKSYTVK